MVKLAKKVSIPPLQHLNLYHCSMSCSNTRFKAQGNNISKANSFFVLSTLLLFYEERFFYSIRALLNSQSEELVWNFSSSIVTVRASSGFVKQKNVLAPRGLENRLKRLHQRIVIRLGFPNRCIFNTYILNTNVFIQFYSLI